MGYPNYAAFELSHKMAKNSENVYKLLNQLLDAYKPVAINEYNAVQGFAIGKEQQNIVVQPWDWSYYSEKLKNIRFNVNDEMTRPYFQLENVKRESLDWLHNCMASHSKRIKRFRYTMKKSKHTKYMTRTGNSLLFYIPTSSQEVANSLVHG